MIYFILLCVALLGGCGHQNKLNEWWLFKNEFKAKCFQHYGEAREMEMFENYRRVEVIYCYRDNRVIFRSKFNFWTYEQLND